MADKTRKRGSEYLSCGCESHFYFDPFEIYKAEWCRYHLEKKNQYENKEVVDG